MGRKRQAASLTRLKYNDIQEYKGEKKNEKIPIEGMSNETKRQLEGNQEEHEENKKKSGCHRVVIFGSTGQSQLISLEEKFELIQNISKSLFKDKFIIGTGLNSLQDTISLIKISNSYNFNNFLIMPPAYYMYEDKDVIRFYIKLIEKLSNCKIILYNLIIYS